jgi:hypothetical protein
MPHPFTDEGNFRMLALLRFVDSQSEEVFDGDQ